MNGYVDVRKALAEGAVHGPFTKAESNLNASRESEKMFGVNSLVK
jgi:hypothetical protein